MARSTSFPIARFGSSAYDPVMAALGNMNRDTGYRIAVVGPIPRDTVTNQEGETGDRYGCAIFATVAVASLAGECSSVHPVAHVRASDHGPISERLARYPTVDLAGISSRFDCGDVIQLTYLDQNRRVERQTGFMRPILPCDVEHLLDCDAFVFVPITDFEVPLETLRFIRDNSDALIVFDAHGPTSGCAKNGQRYQKFWIDRDRWLPYIDLLKMNLEEARCSWFESEADPTQIGDASRLTMDELPLFAEHCLGNGVTALYVTLDQHGCVVYFRNAKGRIREHLVKRVRIDSIVDTTGCGDSFAGGIALGYLMTDDHVAAAQLGNYAGAMRCSSTDLDVYGSLDDAMKRIADEFGD